MGQGGDAKITFEEFVDLMQQVEANIAKTGGVPRPEEAAEQMFQAQQMQQAQPMQRDLTQGRGGIINIAADSKVLDFLRLLEEYRRKCEDEGNYAEARKARAKFDELLKKETARQRNNIRAAQEQELLNIEAAQKAQFLEFSQAWDNYMSDYEATAYLSLEKLKVSEQNFE
jgi:membrane-associated HD superfamily phosphohydrolase